jgi:hypothetical protein
MIIPLMMQKEKVAETMVSTLTMLNCREDFSEF